MSHETIGLISGLIVTFSAFPYAYRAWQGKTTPNLVSWSLWTLITFAILVNYKSSGAGSNIWPAYTSFFNCLGITAIILYRKSYTKERSRIDKYCILFGLSSLVVWWIVKEDPLLSTYGLALGILADACAAIPTIFFVWKFPKMERPFAWWMYAIGYGLSIFAISEDTFANYLPPVYMFVGAFSITLPLIIYRVKNKVPLKEWI